ncbi:MAG: hypothetical protein WC455_17210 [Dehalococcoidia bacterium]|jgi:hypothetical protein
MNFYFNLWRFTVALIVWYWQHDMNARTFFKVRLMGYWVELYRNHKEENARFELRLPWVQVDNLVNRGQTVKYPKGRDPLWRVDTGWTIKWRGRVVWRNWTEEPRRYDSEWMPSEGGNKRREPNEF